MRYLKAYKLGSLLIVFVFMSCGRESGDTLFTRLDSGDTHVVFNNEIADSPDFNVMKYGYFYNGGGVAAADFNNDGFTDLYFTGNIVPDRLYVNQGGDEISFEDITARAGLGRSQGWKTGVSVADINGDGWMDIYVCRSAAESPSLRSNLLYINNGNLTFTESAAQYGLDDTGYSTQAVFFDYDRDGDLDCFILNHSVQRYAGFNQQLASLKKTTDPNYGSKLMRNENGRYRDVSKEAGMISNVLSFGLGVMVSDYNGDRWPDIYVSNDYNEEDYLYINQQNGTFAEQIREATAYTSLFSMGSDAADVNNDGRTDLVTLDMLPESNARIKMTSGDDNYEKYLNLLGSGFHRQYMRNMLQLNTGNLSDVTTKNGQSIPLFQETGQIAGISNTDWSWSALFADFDLDGSKDLFITNGYEKDYTNMEFLNYTVSLQTKIQSGAETLDELAVIEKMPSIREHNYVFKNDGRANFMDMSKPWGMTQTGVSAGAAYADLDNDGDLDLIINNLNEIAGIYRNNTENTATSLKVELKANNQASLIGARVTVFQGENLQLQEYMPVRGFQSCSAGPLVFGLVSQKPADSIVVDWTDGTSQFIKGPVASGSISVVQNAMKKAVQFGSSVGRSPHLSDAPLEVRYQEVNDFKIQPLLPYMLSYPGPHTSMTSSGNLMYVTGSRENGGKLMQVSNGTLRSTNSLVRNGSPVYNESDAIFTDADGDGDEDLIVVYADYQENTEAKELVPVMYRNQGGRFIFDQAAFGGIEGVCAGTVISWDYNEDGRMDLFIGSRVKPGMYPESGSSYLLTNTGNGVFTMERKEHRFDAGMVTDAVLADVNGDKVQDLVISREFGTVAALVSTKKLPDVSAWLDITPTGCWSSVAALDVNGDNKMDIIAGNLGLNNQLAASSSKGLRLHAHTYMGISKAIPVVALNEGVTWYPFAARDELLAQVPVLKKKFSDYTSFASASVEDIFGSEWSQGIMLSADLLETSLWLQGNGGFTKGQLPGEAQFAPVYAICSEDFNGDGIRDILLGGNNTRTRVRIGDMNSSYGTLLTGKEGGSFVYSGEIGLRGEVRSFEIIRKGKKPVIFAGMQQGTSKIITWK